MKYIRPAPACAVAGYAGDGTIKATLFILLLIKGDVGNGETQKGPAPIPYKWEWPGWGGGLWEMRV